MNLDEHPPILEILIFLLYECMKYRLPINSDLIDEEVAEEIRFQDMNEHVLENSPQAQVRGTTERLNVYLNNTNFFINN